MNGSTNTQIVALSAGLATIVMWLLGYFAPGLMATAPTGLEAGITAVFTVVVSLLLPPDAGIKQLPGRGQ